MSGYDWFETGQRGFGPPANLFCPRQHNTNQNGEQASPDMVIEVVIC
jgi:hypothetical protein